MEKGIDLESPKQVMQAFLAGEKLNNSLYFGADGNDIYLYMNEAGYLCEEDGAGAKQDRLPIAMRNDEKWWTVKL